MARRAPICFHVDVVEHVCIDAKIVILAPILLIYNIYLSRAWLTASAHTRGLRSPDD